MLAKLGDEPFDDERWSFEVKWDGIRGLLFVEGGGYRLHGRSRSDLVPRYPELAFLGSLEDGLVLDGELVVMKDGKPDFYLGMQRTHVKDARRLEALARERPADFVVFDVLYRGGLSVMKEPLEERQRILREVVAPVEDPRLVLSEPVPGAGRALYAEAERLALEGIVAKRLDSRYHPGRRTESWVKLKPRKELPCVVLGYLAEDGDLRSLVLGAEEAGALVCVGRVASSLPEERRAALLAALEARAADAPLVECDMDAHWVQPGVFCRVSYLERLETGLRAPVLLDWSLE